MWSPAMAGAFVGLLSLGAGCGESGQARQEGRGEVGPDVVVDAAPEAARELPELGPSGLESIEVVTGGASAADPLPLVIALHDLGADPESLAKSFEGFSHKARFILPRGPLKHEEGRAWFRPGPEAAVSRIVNSTADKVAALAEEIAASRPTKGKAIVTGLSQGGVIAFVVAVRQPERVAAVVPVSATLPQLAWPDQQRFLRDRPVVRALHGAEDELTKATDVRRSIVKLRMLKLDATLRLYVGTDHQITPAMMTDLDRVLGWLVAGTADPPPCAPCPGDSMDPEACSLCPAGPPDQPSPAASIAKGPGPAEPRPVAKAKAPPAEEAADRGGPNVALGQGGLPSVFASGTKGAGGSPSRAEIQQTFRRNMAPIRFCHEQQLERQPGLSGRVNIRFVIAPDGAVSSAEVATSTLGSAAVEECVRRAVTRVRFPQPQGGRPVTVTYPFMFSAAE